VRPAALITMLVLLAAPSAVWTGVLAGDAAPAFSLKDVSGATVSLAGLCGDSAKEKKIVLMDFWATWCPPCRKTLPQVDELGRNYKDKGVETLFVNFKEGENAVNKLLSTVKLTGKVLLDSDGAVGKSYGIGGIIGLPRTVIIGRDCRIVRNLFGESRNFKDDAEEGIQKALAAGK
jgi:thiol-disulfide isomerase/thioredoxin